MKKSTKGILIFVAVLAVVLVVLGIMTWNSGSPVKAMKADEVEMVSAYAVTPAGDTPLAEKAPEEVTAADLMPYMEALDLGEGNPTDIYVSELPEEWLPNFRSFIIARGSADALILQYETSTDCIVTLSYGADGLDGRMLYDSRDDVLYNVIKGSKNIKKLRYSKSLEKELQ